jgi:hemoglobin-like flavoprotein
MEVAKASYGRCRESDAFFRSFYENFFATCPPAEPMFAKTDFDRQIRLLRHAIGLLLIFPIQSREEPTILTRVAERHSRTDLDVAPELYDDFVDALVDTVTEYDPAFTSDVGGAWRRAIAQGVAYMQSKY